MEIPHTLSAQRIEALPARTDAFPDGIDYPDRGCEAGGPSCLSCPLARCVHDISPRRKRNDERREQARAMVAAGASVADVAQAFGVSRRQAIRLRTGHE